MKKILRNVLFLALINVTKQEEIDTSNDSIIIMDCLEAKPGGKTLDTSALPDDMAVINSGHVIIKETATGLLKALGVTDGAYVSLPANHTYEGIVFASVLKARPFVSVMYRGTVNEEAYKNATGLEYPAGAKTALTLIRFTKD